MKTILKEFMRATGPEGMTRPPQDMGEPQPPLELPIPDGLPIIHLPEPANLDFPAYDLRQAIEGRRSVRRYDQSALSLSELASLLWLTQGVKEITKRPATLRTVPSAGARHAFETFVLVNRVDGLEPGLYRFAASQFALVKLTAPADIRERIVHACFDQGQIDSSAVTFIWVAVMERMAWRYTERGYRYLHLDAGHVCQNFYLAAEPLDCGVCAIAAFHDDQLNNELQLDGENQFVIYLASLGKKRPA